MQQTKTFSNLNFKVQLSFSWKHVVNVRKKKEVYTCSVVKVRFNKLTIIIFDRQWNNKWKLAFRNQCFFILKSVIIKERYCQISWPTLTKWFNDVKIWGYIQGLIKLGCQKTVIQYCLILIKEWRTCLLTLISLFTALPHFSKTFKTWYIN